LKPSLHPDPPVVDRYQDYSLAERKYLEEEGTFLFSGIQALVRMVFDKHRRDRRLGRNNNGTYISGYEGSPLGGFDLELARAAKLFTEVGKIVHHPGVNEKLAMSSVYGSQLNGNVDGFWYGKAQGVKWIPDEGGLAAFAGTGRGSGAVILAGDDHQSKSSTFPGASDLMLEDMFSPILFPSSIDEIIYLGLTAMELSRHTGLYTGLKLLTPLCDGASSVRVSPEREQIVIPEPLFPRRHHRVILGKPSLEIERELVEERLESARHFARHNRFNYIVDYQGESDQRIGFIVAGKAYTDLLLAMCDIGCSYTDDPIRILKLGMTYPVEPEIVQRFAEGLTEIIVIEEKRAFIETQVKSILYGRSRAAVWGKHGRDGRRLLPAHGEITPELIVEKLYPFFREYLAGERPYLERRLAQIQEVLEATAEPLVPSRPPTYCSGCPHSRSLKVPEGSKAGGDIGCHTMEIMKELPGRGVEWISSMGTGGAVNNGIFPFAGDRHIFQNLGDGTYFHSGKLSIASSVAAGANITYKLLYNGVVAMTGGQLPPGQAPIEQVAKELEAIGVRRVVVVSERTDLPRHVVVVREREYDALLLEMRQISGTTVIIFDHACATEKRREQSRSGKKRSEFLVINEEVCEGCGDCGKSLCPSLHLPRTELGRKTRIHLSSCNDDLNCLKGDCPAFMRVEAAGEVDDGLDHLRGLVAAYDLPHPEGGGTLPLGNYNIVVAGIGGTGVVSLSAVLAQASILDGGHVNELNMTGLAQKGGPVESQIIMNLAEQPIINAIGYREADLYIVCDTIHGLAASNLRTIDRERTRVVVNLSVVPTIDMIIDRDLPVPEGDELREEWRKLVPDDSLYTVDAGRVVEELMANHMFTNIFLLGVAVQRGHVPVRVRALEEAIRQHLRQPENNLLAFRLGRLWVAAPERIQAELRRRRELLGGTILDRSRARYGSQVAREFADLRPLFDELAEARFEDRVCDLIEYQDLKLARSYAERVRRVHAAERAPSRPLTRAVVRYLYKLMAYKDEYEVARLHLFRMEHPWVRSTFGSESSAAVYLMPPLLRSTLRGRKLRIAPNLAEKLFTSLLKLKRLRATPADPFGWTRMRRFDRDLVRWYEGELEQLSSPSIDPAEALRIASLPERIRGYEGVRVASVRKLEHPPLEQLLARRGL
jgi:indolepyruvate ferredoxin oxidoreductase